MIRKAVFYGAAALLFFYLAYVFCYAVFVINPKVTPQTSSLIQINVRERMAVRLGVNAYYTYNLTDRNNIFTRKIWLNALPSFAETEYRQFKNVPKPINVCYYAFEQKTSSGRHLSPPFGLRPGLKPAKTPWYWLAVVHYISGNLYLRLYHLLCLFAAIAAYGFNENFEPKTRKPFVLLVINFVVFFSFLVYFYA